MALTAADTPEAVKLLSQDRLAKLQALTGQPEAAINLHLHVMTLGAALASTLGLLEIALRNAAFHEISTSFGTQDWLLNPPAPFQWHQEEKSKIALAVTTAHRAEYSKLNSAQKKALDAIAFPGGVPSGTKHHHRARARQRAVTITTGHLVAQLTIFFWKRLFSSDYDGTLWQRSLKKCFPNHAISRADAAKRLETIYVARNRVAHHEHVVGTRLARTLDAIEWVTANLYATTPSSQTVLAKMLAVQRTLLAVEIARLDAFLAGQGLPPFS